MPTPTKTITRIKSAATGEEYYLGAQNSDSGIIPLEIFFQNFNDADSYTMFIAVPQGSDISTMKLRFGRYGRYSFRRSEQHTYHERATYKGWRTPKADCGKGSHYIEPFTLDDNQGFSFTRYNKDYYQVTLCGKGEVNRAMDTILFNYGSGEETCAELMLGKKCGICLIDINTGIQKSSWATFTVRKGHIALS